MGVHGTFRVDGTVCGGVGGVALLGEGVAGCGLREFKAWLRFHFTVCFTLACEDASPQLLLLPTACCHGPNHGGLLSLWNLTPQ